MEINGFKISKYNIHNLDEGKKYSTCPICSAERKKKTQKCLSVFWDSGLAKCSHCNEVIQLHEYEKNQPKENYKLPEWENNTQLSDKLIKWFEGRNISQFVLRLMDIGESVFSMPDKTGWKDKNTVQFPYKRNGHVINVKYRGGDKSFRFTAGCELMPYNLDNIQGQETIYCVEGEMDVLAVMEAGIHNVTSPPNGFPKKGQINLEWLNSDVEHFIKAEKIVLVFDNDEPGQNGTSEFIRRFGAHKCFKCDLKECKDSNEYSIKYGKEELKKALENHIEIPLENISTYNDYKEKVRDFFLNGMPKGLITGTLKDFDNVFSTNTSQTLLVTGKPSSGKSEVVDQMCCSYAIKYGFKTAFASVENKPNQLHQQKLIRKLVGISPKTKDDFNDSFVACEDFSNNHFYMIDSEQAYDLDMVLTKAEELVYRKGIRVLVIDPFNKVRYKGEVESITGNKINDYTNKYITKLDEFSVKFDVLTILVAHPVKLPRAENGKRNIPDMYDVKGGGEFYDMFYHGIAVDRDYNLDLTLIRTLKVKFAHLGKNNEDTWFKYNMNNGRLDNILGDPVNNFENLVIDWDNKNWVTSKLNNTPQKELFEPENNDDLKESYNWYEKDNEEAPF